jgi:hypothetical protein
MPTFVTIPEAPPNYPGLSVTRAKPPKIWGAISGGILSTGVKMAPPSSTGALTDPIVFPLISGKMKFSTSTA